MLNIGLSDSAKYRIMEYVAIKSEVWELELKMDLSYNIVCQRKYINIIIHLCVLEKLVLIVTVVKVMKVR